MLLTLLSQTVTPSRTPSPSSVTYFMDGPLVVHFDPSSTTQLTSCLFSGWTIHME